MPQTKMSFALRQRQNIRSCNRFLKVPAKATGTSTLSTPSPILSLPSDILLIIGSFLSPSSAAALSITCKTFERSLGATYIDQCSADSEYALIERHLLLELLSHDQKDKIGCFYCQCLHKVPLKPEPYYLRKRRCDNAQRELLVPRDFFDDFCLTNVQMAAKLSRTGNDPTAYLASMTRKKRAHTYIKDHTTYIVYEPRISEGEVIFRSQIWTLIPPSRLAESDDDSQTAGYTQSGFEVCRHTHMNIKSDIMRSYKCHCGHLRKAEVPCANCSTLKRCSLCNTEYQVHSKDYGLKGVAIIVTRWYNMGSCRTPKDPKLQALIKSSYYGLAVTTNGMVMSRFEGCAPAEFVPSLKREEEAAFLLPRWKWEEAK